MFNSSAPSNSTHSTLQVCKLSYNDGNFTNYIQVIVSSCKEIGKYVHIIILGNIKQVATIGKTRTTGLYIKR